MIFIIFLLGLMLIKILGEIQILSHLKQSQFKSIELEIIRTFVSLITAQSEFIWNWANAYYYYCCINNRLLLEKQVNWHIEKTWEFINNAPDNLWFDAHSWTVGQSILLKTDYEDPIQSKLKNLA